jgi:Na+/H+ antiporter NhaD/arsenite permease-like protein
MAVVALSLPLVLLLLSLAVLPIVAGGFWKRYEATVFAGLSTASVILSAIFLGDTVHIFKHAIINDYLPFIITLFVLYILSNGIKIELGCSPTPLANVIFLLVCSACSSAIGTTGASILFLRPFLEMNKSRQSKVHLVVFFIFLVSNIGGLLSPLGDPPLFLGYLHGIDFTWELGNLLVCWMVYTGACLVVLYFIDRLVLRREPLVRRAEFSIKISGGVNGLLLLLAIGVLFINSGIPPILKNILLLVVCFISHHLEKRRGETINFAPFMEVVRTFFAIFIAMAPVLVILLQNSDAIHEYIVTSGTRESSIYFWLCALASSFLDNAPSYLMFFNMAGGDGQALMHSYPEILRAISVSAVVMGSMTYIGNAPNMLVRTISMQAGVRMPSFVGYMLWSVLVILPISLFVVHFVL